MARWTAKRSSPGDDRERERQFGSLRIQDNVVRYTRAGAEEWSLLIDSIILIGEHTTDNGPFAIDYWCVFIAGAPLVHRDAPMYANPRLLDELGRFLGAELRLGLVNSTQFKSRIIWPEPLADQPLFEYRPVRRHGIRRLLLDRIAPLVGHSYSLTVESFLKKERCTE